MSTILLDMDGVIADFVGGVCQLFNRMDLKEKWPNGVYELKEALGVSNNEIWRKINEAGPDFWNNLGYLDRGLVLYEKCLRAGMEVVICTSPSLDPSCVAGKLSWLQTLMGRGFRNYMFGCKKELMAGAGILIDDNDYNVTRFCDAGGQAILYPQPWNSLYFETNRQLETTLECLDRVLELKQNELA